MLRLTMVVLIGILLVWGGAVCAGELEVWTQTLPSRILRTVPVENYEFTVAWEHSVEHFQWRETYQITSTGGLRLLRSSTKGYGAGTPDRRWEGAAFRVEQEWLVSEPVGLELEEVLISLSSLAPHWLESGGVRLSLLEVAGEEAIILRPRHGVAADHR